jgi:hypothetical protein
LIFPGDEIFILSSKLISYVAMTKLLHSPTCKVSRNSQQQCGGSMWIVRSVNSGIQTAIYGKPMKAGNPGTIKLPTLEDKACVEKYLGHKCMFTWR